MRYFKEDSNNDFKIENGVLKRYLGNSEKVVIPKDVVKIDDFAFDNCNSLTTITIPNNVTNIGHRAFISCYNLSSVTIGNGVTNIGEGAFSVCSNLTNITIPHSVTNIKDCTFFRCGKLKSIIIPNSIKSIEEDAFEDCKNLKDIIFESDSVKIDVTSFKGCPLSIDSQIQISICNYNATNDKDRFIQEAHEIYKRIKGGEKPKYDYIDSLTQATTDVDTSFTFELLDYIGRNYTQEDKKISFDDLDDI